MQRSRRLDDRSGSQPCEISIARLRAKLRSTTVGIKYLPGIFWPWRSQQQSTMPKGINPIRLMVISMNRLLFALNPCHGKERNFLLNWTGVEGRSSG
jgi:hypothetical protein